MVRVVARELENSVSVATRSYLREVTRVGIIGVVLFAAALSFFTSMPVGEGVTRTLLTKAIYYVGPVVALILYLIGIRRAPAEQRRSQRWWASTLIVLGVLSTVVGDAIWDIASAVRNTDAVGVGLQDVFYMAQYALLCFGVMLIPRPAVSKDSRLRVVLDSVTMAVATTRHPRFPALPLVRST